MNYQTRRLPFWVASRLSRVLAAQGGPVYGQGGVISPVRLVMLVNHCQRPEGSTAI